VPSFFRSAVRTRPRRTSAAVLLVACTLLAAACARPVRSSAPTALGLPGTTREQLIERDLIARVNDERAARGLTLLTIDPNLMDGAYSWSHTMAAQNVMYHSNLNTWMGPYVADAENIGWETSPTMTAGNLHVLWMRSDHHRENILAPNLTHVGIGVACVNGKMWGTERFGSVGSRDFGSVPPVNPIVRSDPGTLSC
jgi:uncharacterized protein YkwD